MSVETPLAICAKCEHCDRDGFSEAIAPLWMCARDPQVPLSVDTVSGLVTFSPLPYCEDENPTGQCVNFKPHRENIWQRFRSWWLAVAP